MYVFTIYVCFVIGYIKEFIPNSLSSQLSILMKFALRTERASALELMRLGGRKDVQSVKLCRA